MPTAHADNARLNGGVIDVYTMQHEARCTANTHVDPAAAPGSVAHG